jgi:hypothetical protein
MSHSKRDIDVIMDDALDSIRTEHVDDATVRRATDRVWRLIAEEQAVVAPVAVSTAQAETIRNCNDFQSLIPSYLKGELGSARRLLLEDHTQECIPCRKALKVAREGSRVVSIGAQRRTSAIGSQFTAWKWRIAASLILVLGAAGVFAYLRYGSFAAHSTVYTSNGQIYRVTNNQIAALKPGEDVSRFDRIRTAKDSTAVIRLDDGSLVEMKDRSEIYVTENSQGTTVHLDRGNVIVEAAKQRNKHLYVATEDALVSVTGTIFSVNSGTKGSRVSVVQGEVHVNHAKSEQVLRPGEQATTQTSIEKVSIQDEVAWSRNADEYIKMLADLAAIRKEIDERVPRIGVRYSTRFLDMQPDGTVLYAALPNFATTLAESHRIMQERISQNAALKAWWEKSHGSKNGEAETDQIINRIRQFGEYLGAEIVVSATMSGTGEPVGPLVMADLKNANGFRAFVEEQIKAASDAGKNGPSVRFIDDPLTALAAQQNEILIWVNGDYFAASPKLELIKQLAGNVSSSATNQFSSTSFHDRIADIYREGAGLIVAADLEKILPQVTNHNGVDSGASKALDQLGISNVKHLIVEQKEGQAKTNSRVVLSFNDQRRGIASWLAAPGPMGSLDYISPNANLVVAFVVKEPTALVDDLLGLMDKVSPDVRKHLNEVESQHGLNLRQDIAAPLGGEFALAVDGPVLPTPSWKMVFEVYDPATLQQTIEKLVAEANKFATSLGKKGLGIEKEEANGRTYFTLKSLDIGLEAHYAFVNGYMIACPSRALIDSAINYHDSGVTLTTAPRFRAGLPEDGNANFSALFYYDFGSIVAPLANRVANSNGALTDEQKKAIGALRANAMPTLAYVYAEKDRIVLSANMDGGPFGFGASSMMGAPNMLDLHQLLSQATKAMPGK